MRGLPGSGKSTEARAIAIAAIETCAQEVAICSTDSFFMVNGEYQFDPDKLGDYHGANQHKVGRHMYMKTDVIIVDNTNTTRKEMKPYTDLAAAHGYEVTEVLVGREFLFGAPHPALPWTSKDHDDYGDYIAKCHERGTHGVPKVVIERMARRFQE